MQNFCPGHPYECTTLMSHLAEVWGAMCIWTQTVEVLWTSYRPHSRRTGVLSLQPRIWQGPFTALTSSTVEIDFLLHFCRFTKI